MKYYIDTEFLEGTQKEKFPISLFRKYTKPTIDLISIGLVSEDNREYYAISKDFNLKEAWNRFDRAERTPFEKYHQFSGRKIYWIRENVLKPIWRELFFDADDCLGLSTRQIEHYRESVMKGGSDKHFTYKSLKFLIQKYGKTNKQIADEIKEFCTKHYEEDKGVHSVVNHNHPYKNNTPKFHAYYADYDWVVFCWLFGKMIDLPKGFPMYCYDLKQLMDEKVKSLDWDYIKHTKSSCNSIKEINSVITPENDREATFEEKLAKLKSFVEYPKNENDHHALSDAKFDKALHEFLYQL